MGEKVLYTIIFGSREQRNALAKKCRTMAEENTDKKEILLEWADSLECEEY